MHSWLARTLPPLAVSEQPSVFPDGSRGSAAFWWLARFAAARVLDAAIWSSEWIVEGAKRFVLGSDSDCAKTKAPPPTIGTKSAKNPHIAMILRMMPPTGSTDRRSSTPPRSSSRTTSLSLPSRWCRPAGHGFPSRHLPSWYLAQTSVVGLGRSHPTPSAAKHGHLPERFVAAARHHPVAPARPFPNLQDDPDQSGIGRVPVLAPASVLEGGRIQRVEPRTLVDAWLVDVFAVALADSPPVPSSISCHSGWKPGLSTIEAVGEVNGTRPRHPASPPDLRGVHENDLLGHGSA